VRANFRAGGESVSRSEPLTDARRAFVELTGACEAENVGPNPYRDVVERARVRLQTGDDLEAVLVDMRASGMSEISCIKAVRDLFDVELGDAKAMVHFSEAFADRREANEELHESLVGALTEINEVESGPMIRRPSPQTQAASLATFAPLLRS